MLFLHSYHPPACVFSPCRHSPFVPDCPLSGDSPFPLSSSAAMFPAFVPRIFCPPPVRRSHRPDFCTPGIVRLATVCRIFSAPGSPRIYFQSRVLNTGFPASGHQKLHPAEPRSFERGDFFNMSTATLMSECAIEFRCCRHELMFCRISLTSLHGGVMNSTIHRHDISDHVWSILEPLLPGRKESWGGKARDNRLFINAVFRILRTGAPCELFRRSTATGKILIAVFVVGVTMEYGKKSCLI